MASAMPDPRLLPSCRTLVLCDWYQITLLGDRGMCVNNLPKVVI